MQVAEAERREARLKEVFKAQVSNFREACFCLFGYRVDMASQARLVLSAAVPAAVPKRLSADPHHRALLPHLSLPDRQTVFLQQQLGWHLGSCGCTYTLLHAALP